MLSRRAALVLLATGCLAPAPVAAQRDKPVHLGILSMTSAFELVINAKAAEALGVKLHPALLTRADTVLR